MDILTSRKLQQALKDIEAQKQLIEQLAVAMLAVQARLDALEAKRGPGRPRKTDAT